MRKPPAGLGNRCFIAPNNKHRDVDEGARHRAGRHRESFHRVTDLIRAVESCTCGTHYRPRLFTAPEPPSPAVISAFLSDERHHVWQSPCNATNCSLDGPIQNAPTRDRNWWNGFTECSRTRPI
jgi:hypothetical protein